MECRRVQSHAEAVGHTHALQQNCVRGQISKGICPCSFVPFQLGARRGNAADASFGIFKGVGAMGRVLSLLRRAVQHGGIACMQILQKKGYNKEKEKGKRI